jgi:hypothetical protein
MQNSHLPDPKCTYRKREIINPKLRHTPTSHIQNVPIQYQQYFIQKLRQTPN